RCPHQAKAPSRFALPPHPTFPPSCISADLVEQLCGMELYFKDLISDDASLEKLVDDLALGAEDFAQSIEAGISEQTRREVASRVNRFKESCDRLKENAVAGAHATD